MLKTKVNNKYDFAIDEDVKKSIDLIEVKQGIFHIIKNNKSYTAEVLKANHEEKNFVIRVNGNKYTVQLKDKYDDLLKELGIDNVSAKKVKEMKAPMPGLVVDIRVNEGDEIKKGDRNSLHFFIFFSCVIIRVISSCNTGILCTIMSQRISKSIPKYP